MKAVIIYNSKTGFTRRYAQWLAEALGCDCVPFERRMKVRLDDYDAVIFGSWLRAGTIQGISWFKEQLPNMTGGLRIVFAVGAMPAEADAEVRKMFEKNFTDAQRGLIEPFYLQGGIDYGRMDFVSRAAMRMLCRMIRGKKNRTPEDEGMLRMIEKSFDGTKREALEPIIALVGGAAEED